MPSVRAAAAAAAVASAGSLCYEPDSSVVSPTCQALLFVLDDLPAASAHAPGQRAS